MPPRDLLPLTAQVWESFVTLNRSDPHPLDWQRFYQFVRWVHRYRVKLTEIDVRELLEALDPPPSASTVDRLVTPFVHARGVLATPGTPRPDYEEYIQRLQSEFRRTAR